MADNKANYDEYRTWNMGWQKIHRTVQISLRNFTAFVALLIASSLFFFQSKL